MRAGGIAQWSRVSTDCSSKGPKSDSQTQAEWLKPPRTLAPGHLDSMGAHIHAYMHSHIHVIKNKSFFKLKKTNMCHKASFNKCLFYFSTKHSKNSWSADLNNYT